MPRVWLAGGLGARRTGRAPGHSGYLVEHWPLMVVPHNADIGPDVWDNIAGDVSLEAPCVAPYLRENWNGETLDHFVRNEHSEWHTWDRARKAQLVRHCLRIFLLPYYTIIEAADVAGAHLQQGAAPVPETSGIRRRGAVWGQEVCAEGMSLSSFLAVRSPIEPGNRFSPALAVHKVIRHPSHNAPIVLDLNDEIAGLMGAAPLVSGIHTDDGGVARLVWPALLQWRRQAAPGQREAAAAEEEVALPTLLQYACRVTGADAQLVGELLAFLEGFAELDEESSFIAALAPELLASEVVRNHPAAGDAVPDGLTAAYMIPPYAWKVAATLDERIARIGRSHLWLYDHQRVVDLFAQAERAASTDKDLAGLDGRRLSAAMQNWLNREAADKARGRSCWVCLKKWEQGDLAGATWNPDDWALLEQNHAFVKAALRVYGADYPFTKRQSIELFAGKDEPAPEA